MMFFSQRKKEKARLKAVMEICVYSYQGINKRLDENGALLELLYQEAPEFIEKCPWVEGWIMSQDAFLTNLEKALEITTNAVPNNFPRKWPTNPNES